MIAGIILAAGESRRMGTPKQLLPWGNTIVLQRVIDVAAASRLDVILLVLGHLAEEIAGRVALPPRARLAINPDFSQGMNSSVKCGIAAAPPGTEAYMLLLGDQPFVEVHVIDALIASYRQGRRGITIPVFGGRRGHPVIFDARHKEELLAMDERGARAVVAAHAAEICEVPVASAEILADLDTAEQYRAAARGTGNDGN